MNGDNITIKIDRKDFATLCICAVRYCQGRQTYMPDLVRGIVRPFIKDISDNDLNVMVEDCEFQKRFDLYGDEQIDKPGWIEWKKFLLKERRMRNEE